MVFLFILDTFSFARGYTNSFIDFIKFGFIVAGFVYSINLSRQKKSMLSIALLILFLIILLLALYAAFLSY